MSVWGILLIILGSLLRLLELRSNLGRIILIIIFLWNICWLLELRFNLVLLVPIILNFHYLFFRWCWGNHYFWFFVFLIMMPTNFLALTWHPLPIFQIMNYSVKIIFLIDNLFQWLIKLLHNIKLLLGLPSTLNIWNFQNAILERISLD